MIEKQLMLRARMEMNPQTPQIMGGGLDTAPSGDMFEAAGGGIVAFSEGATVKSKKPEGIMDFRDLIRQRLTAQETGNPFAKSEEETYVRFPKSFPSDLFPGYKGGTIARLKRNLYGSKSAPKLWYNCLYQFIIELGFKSVAGHP
jgi:hypothetical protein